MSTHVKTETVRIYLKSDKRKIMAVLNNDNKSTKWTAWEGSMGYGFDSLAELLMGIEKEFKEPFNLVKITASLDVSKEVSLP